MNAQASRSGGVLLLLFRSGEQRYALEASRVVEVLPRVALRPIPHAPAPLLGLLHYRGALIPVVEFNAVVGAPPAPDRLSTRVIVAEVAGPGGAPRRLGILAERVNHVARGEPSAPALARLGLAEAPYLGPILRADDDLVQLIKADALLPDRLRDALLLEPTEAT